MRPWNFGATKQGSQLSAKKTPSRLFPRESACLHPLLLFGSTAAYRSRQPAHLWFRVRTHARYKEKRPVRGVAGWRLKICCRNACVHSITQKIPFVYLFFPPAGKFGKKIPLKASICRAFCPCFPFTGDRRRPNRLPQPTPSAPLKKQRSFAPDSKPF